LVDYGTAEVGKALYHPEHNMMHCISQLTSSQGTLPDHQYSILNMWHFQAAVFAGFGLQPFQCKHSLAFGPDFKSPIEK
jgi:hypothetical protein